MHTDCRRSVDRERVRTRTDVRRRGVTHILGCVMMEGGKYLEYSAVHSTSQAYVDIFRIEGCMDKYGAGNEHSQPPHRRDLDPSDSGGSATVRFMSTAVLVKLE